MIGRHPDMHGGNRPTVRDTPLPLQNARVVPLQPPVPCGGQPSRSTPVASLPGYHSCLYALRTSGAPLSASNAPADPVAAMVNAPLGAPRGTLDHLPTITNPAGPPKGASTDAATTGRGR